MNNNEDQNLKDAQYRKSLSIAFFNATNAAIELFKAQVDYMPAGLNNSDKNIQEFVGKWRDWFLEQHMEYYSNKVSNVGALYDSKETIKKLEATKSKDELNSAWITLSEDERRDGEIIAKAKELKQKYETSQDATT